MKGQLLTPQIIGLSLLSFLLSSLLFGLELYSTWLSPFGTIISFITACISGPLYVLARFILIPLSLILMISLDTRKHGLRLLSSCLSFLIPAIICLHLSDTLQVQGFQRLIDQEEVVVAAITAFETANNQPPQTLQDLVPDFLPSIPKRLGDVHINYQLITGTEALSYGDNTWVLKMEIPVPMLDYAFFVYFPNQDYPNEWRRVGKWGLESIH
jgi:hypothetical protein